MLVFKSVSALVGHFKNEKLKSHSVGFVPTMGALHSGHISLLHAAREENDVVIVSIFVNPLQFNNQNDLEFYPRPLNDDIALLEKNKCDILFLPSAEEIFSCKPLLKLDFGNLDTVLEGKHRPGHFNGVGIIVSKLFNIVQPDKAYFGQKDLQQFLIVQQLVNDLSFQIKLERCPIIRENDGLALSSRNLRIPSPLREKASVIYKSLCLAEGLLNSKPIPEIEKEIDIFFKNYPEIQLEYFKIVDSDSLKEVYSIQDRKEVALCIAAVLGGIRLIDNKIIAIN